MTSINDSLSARITSTPSGMRQWQRERVIVEVTERICELMEERNITRSQLADELGKTRGYITHILRGNANLTLSTISDVYLALGRQFHADDGPVSIESIRAPQIITFCPVDDDDPVTDWSDEMEVTLKVN